MTDDKEHQWHDFDELPRLTILPWIIWAAIILAVIFTTKALADPVFKETGNDGRPVSLRLSDKPCTSEKVLAHLKANVKPQYIPLFKAAVLHYAGKNWDSCWIEYGGAVLSIDEEGAPFNPPSGIPLHLFKEETV